MRPEFFRHESHRVQERFNRTFGKQTVCNLETRYRVILSIISMELIGKRIINAENKDKVGEEIRQFVRLKNALNQIFDRAEKMLG
jgi:hypothetical protein